MKKGPLSNKEKEYITANLSGFSGNIGELAETMNRSASIVQKFIGSLKSQVETLPKDQDNSDKHTSSLFVRNKEHGVTVMTEAASMAGDDGKADRTQQTPSRYRQFIHKIKDSE
jgi:hypothetical protein